MRALALLAVVSCSSPALPPAPVENLALTMMHVIDPAGPCTSLYTDVGDKHLHAAVCVTRAGLAYCRIATDTGPSCSPIEQGKDK